jgi:hypothetical protein
MKCCSSYTHVSSKIVNFSNVLLSFNITVLTMKCFLNNTPTDTLTVMHMDVASEYHRDKFFILQHYVKISIESKNIWWFQKACLPVTAWWRFWDLIRWSRTECSIQAAQTSSSPEPGRGKSTDQRAASQTATEKIKNISQCNFKLQTLKQNLFYFSAELWIIKILTPNILSTHKSW